MGLLPHKTKTSRRLITVNELAEYYGVDRKTMRSYIAEFGTLDQRDVYSIMEFVTYLVHKKVQKHAQAQTPTVD